MYTDIPEFDKSLLNYCEEYIHRASQFLAMFGKNYLEDEPDDSNANLGFDAKTSKIKSRTAEGFSLDLDVPGWKLEAHSKGRNNSCELIGKKKEEVFEWLRDELIASGLNGEKLKFIDHYEIPDHAIEHGHSFPEMIGMVVDKWLIMRADANEILTELNKIVGIKSEVRIWPHHFDTGTYYSFAEDKAIGAGWAMADTLCDNPYLYIYGWNGNGSIDYDSVPELETGKWIVNESWQGAVVESEALSLTENQHESVTAFMNTVIEFLKKQLNQQGNI